MFFSSPSLTRPLSRCPEDTLRHGTRRADLIVSVFDKALAVSWCQIHVCHVRQTRFLHHPIHQPKQPGGRRTATVRNRERERGRERERERDAHTHTHREVDVSRSLALSVSRCLSLSVSLCHSLSLSLSVFLCLLRPSSHRTRQGAASKLAQGCTQGCSHQDKRGARQGIRRSSFPCRV